MIIFMNSEFIKDTEATISPFDHGFLYGLGAFETFRMYNGFPFLLNDHLKRLQAALLQLGISYKLDREEIFRMLQKLVDLNQLQAEDVIVRLNISAGTGEVGKLAQTYQTPNILCFLRGAPSVAEPIEKDARILKTPRNTPEGPFRIKSHHYLNNIIGKREIQNTPEAEGFFLTEKGFLAEGVVSNIFWVKDNRVFTPALETGILNGITRQFVIKCLRVMGVAVEEGLYNPEDLLGASEVFITNSSQEIVSIKKVDDRLFRGNDGIIVKKLTELYRQNRKKLLSIEEL